MSFWIEIRCDTAECPANEEGRFGTTAWNSEGGRSAIRGLESAALKEAGHAAMLAGYVRIVQ